MARPLKSGGFALLLSALLVLLVSAAIYVQGTGIRPSWAFLQPNQRTEAALLMAKMALLGYAAAYPEIRQKDTNNRPAFVPGHLPCPTLDNTGNLGQESPQCGTQGVSALGRLPWTSLGLPPLQDENGECLWYAVSGNHKTNPKANLLNPDTPGLLSILIPNPTGTPMVLEDVVAVIIAPGKPLPGQTRTTNPSNPCSSALQPENFLDPFPGGSNTTLSTAPEGVSVLMQSPSPGEFSNFPNDRMVWITRKELFETVRKRQSLRTETALFDPAYPRSSNDESPALIQRVAECLRAFALSGNGSNPGEYGRLPWAAPMNLTTAAPNTFKNDRFNDQKNLLSGRIPMFLWDSKQAMGSRSFPGTLNLCSSSTDTNCRLFRTNNCPSLLPIAGYPTASDNTYYKDAPDGWLDKWKDRLFYAVAPAFQPGTGYASTCSTNNCLQVNGRSYAAIVLYAGDPQSGQQRLSNQNKTQVGNYLEGNNATSLSTNGRIFGQAGNDQMACLRPDLTLSSRCQD